MGSTARSSEVKASHSVMIILIVSLVMFASLLVTLLQKFSKNGHFYNSLEENRVRGNIIILDEEENESKANKLSPASASELTVSNEIKGCRAEIKVSCNK